MRLLIASIKKLGTNAQINSITGRSFFLLINFVQILITGIKKSKSLKHQHHKALIKKYYA